MAEGLMQEGEVIRFWWHAQGRPWRHTMPGRLGCTLHVIWIVREDQIIHAWDTRTQQTVPPEGIDMRRFSRYLHATPTRMVEVPEALLPPAIRRWDELLVRAGL